METPFSGWTQVVKNPEYEQYIHYSENFQGKRMLLISRELWKNFQNSVYWASVVCNQDQRRDWL